MKNFVTFEGIDGSGKSTVSKLVYKKMKEEGFDVVLTQEPTDSWIGEQVKRCIKEDTDPFVTSFTFISDRILHGKKIERWIDEGKTVLCDRYAESTYAYQSVQMEDLVDEPVKWLKDLSKNRIPIPDKTFLFILDPEEAISRIQDRDDLIPFEKQKFLDKVQKNYLKICEGSRFKKVDASQSINRLVDICYKVIEKD
ncbi:MAG: dTMP kinase [Candidatus Thermoplasmatota archaeon]